MPSVGTPSSKRDGSTRGAPSAYTDAGPPERISAAGFRRRSSSAVDRCETSSEYTRASRTRRAISCEYWPPRSTTSTGRSSGAGCSAVTLAVTSGAAVIRCVLGDGDVVRVRLPEAGPGDADEARLLHRVDRRRAAVAHRLPQTADELLQHAGERALVRHATLDPLGHELLDVLDVALEVTVLREPACLHRAERAHAAVLLVALALRDHHVAGRLVGAGEHRADHHRVGSGGDGLRDVPGRGDAAVADHGHAVGGRDL